jgi:8-oxo-dGTP pyrophosphatase MutT (NUDIX family)
MGDPCNHAVVGVLPEWNGRYLTGLRGKSPIAIAPPAGHVDELAARIPTGSRGEEPAFRAAGVRELEEETGLRVRDRDLHPVLNRLGGDRCHRTAGSVDGDNWHWWLVFTVAFTGPEPPKTRSNGELNDLTWRTAAELAALPNLEPIWWEFLRQLRII